MDEPAFRALFDAHLPDVWRYARRRCPTMQDADDVAAEVFAIAWRRRRDVPAENPRLWLLGVARRVLANQRRSSRRLDRLRRRVAEAAPTVWTGGDALPAEAAAVGSDPAASRLWRALAALPPGDRDLLIMRAWDELPVTAIAELLGCSANAVSVRLYKARRRLAAALDRTGEHDCRTSDGRTLAPEGGQP